MNNNIIDKLLNYRKIEVLLKEKKDYNKFLDMELKKNLKNIIFLLNFSCITYKIISEYILKVFSEKDIKFSDTITIIELKDDLFDLDDIPLLENQIGICKKITKGYIENTSLLVKKFNETFNSKYIDRLEDLLSKLVYNKIYIIQQDNIKYIHNGENDIKLIIDVNKIEYYDIIHMRQIYDNKILFFDDFKFTKYREPHRTISIKIDDKIIDDDIIFYKELHKLFDKLSIDITYTYFILRILEFLKDHDNIIKIDPYISIDKLNIINKSLNTNSAITHEAKYYINLILGFVNGSDKIIKYVVLDGNLKSYFVLILIVLISNFYKY